MRRWILGCLALFLVAMPATSGKKLKYNDKEKEFLNLVDLIITLEERKVFRKKLTTHRERDQFMELFWAKRDPDLTDNHNPFRTEWMARRDYVITHFKDHEFRQTSINKGELFMLLGPPSDKSHLVDLSLMGPGYRNRYTRFPPELWVYDDPPFDYKRRKLKVQFIATSAFGEYVAITDRLTDHFLRNIKFKFIHHPDLEEAPLNAYASADYQTGTVELTGEGAPRVVAVTEPDYASPAAPPPVAAPTVNTSTSATAVETGTESTVAVATPPKNPVAVPVPVTAPKPIDKSKVTIAPPKTEKLVVPSTLSNAVAKTSAVTYDKNAGNEVELRARSSYFKSGTDKRLLLGRLGFPLNNVDFTYEENEYTVGFQLDFHLFGRTGKALHGDSLRTEVAMPSKRALKKRTTWFSKEFAVIVPGDRYTLKAQLTELGSGRVSYLEMPIEVPPLRDDPHATELVFMDPNVNPGNAKFNIRGKPYNLRLSHDSKKGDRIYPVTELINVNSADQISTIEIQAINDSAEVVKTWDLYTGEMTNTNHGSFLLHPVLNTKVLDKGTYTLRIEVAMENGDLLLSEAPLTLD